MVLWADIRPDWFNFVRLGYDWLQMDLVIIVGLKSMMSLELAVGLKSDH